MLPSIILEDSYFDVNNWARLAIPPINSLLIVKEAFNDCNYIDQVIFSRLGSVFLADSPAAD